MNNNKSLSHTTFKSVSEQTVVTVGMAILTLVIFSVMSRLLTKEEFGIFALLSAIYAIFSAISEAGMGAALIQYKEPTKEYRDTAFNLALLTGIGITLLSIVSSKLIARLTLDESIIFPLRILSLGLLFHGLISVVQAQLTRELKFVKIGTINFCSTAAGGLVAITLAYFRFGIYSIIAQHLLVTIINFIVLFIYMPSKPKLFYISKDCSKQIFSFGGWLSASVLFRMLYQQMDKLFMSNWLSVTILGSYNRPAGFISTLSSRLNSIFDTVLFPILSSVQDDKNRIHRAYDQIIYMCGLYSGILCVCIMISSRLLIAIFFGSDWFSVIQVFNILTFTLLLSIIGRVMDCFIRSLALVKAGFYMRVIACVITFVNLYVGKEFGVVGIACASVLSSTVIILMKLLYINKIIDMPIMHTLKVFFSSQYISFIPIIAYLLLFSFISNSNLISIIAVIVVVLYYFFVFLLKPSLLGDYIHHFIESKYPRILKRK